MLLHRSASLERRSEVVHARCLLCEQEDLGIDTKVKAWKSWSFIFYSTLLLAGPPFVAGHLAARSVGLRKLNTCRGGYDLV